MSNRCLTVESSVEDSIGSGSDAQWEWRLVVWVWSLKSETSLVCSLISTLADRFGFGCPWTRVLLSITEQSAGWRKKGCSLGEWDVFWTSGRLDVVVVLLCSQEECSVCWLRWAHNLFSYCGVDERSGTKLTSAIRLLL